jgi:hypothetical protein
MAQGAMQQQQGGGPEGAGMVQQAMQALEEVKASAEKLLQSLQGISPQTQQLVIPMVQAYKAIKEDLTKLAQRAGAGQPNMAGQGPMPGGGMPSGNPGEGMPPGAA